MTVDAKALRANWDATCDRAIAAVDAALADEPGGLAWYLTKQRKAVRGIKLVADGRRYLPGPGLSTGILYEIPPELGEPAYADLVEILDQVRKLWAAGLGAEGWDWSRGYPPNWPSTFADRLRAGLVYRRK